MAKFVAQGRLLVVCAILVTVNGEVQAQSCTSDGAALTRCRLMLSEPQSFAVEADTSLLRPPRAHPSSLTLEVDGRDCRTSRQTKVGSFHVVCAVELSAGEHIIQAQLKTQNPGLNTITVALSPASRLAALPREERDLYPSGMRQGLSRYWPF